MTTPHAPVVHRESAVGRYLTTVDQIRVRLWAGHDVPPALVATAVELRHRVDQLLADS